MKFPYFYKIRRNSNALLKIHNLKRLFFVIFIVTGQVLFAQMPHVLKNKWGFIGNGILFFSEREGKPFVELMEQDTYSFIDLYTKGESKDTRFQDKIKVIDTV
jgi:hypothetical protein